jgi:hypothetical protein
LGDLHIADYGGSVELLLAEDLLDDRFRDRHGYRGAPEKRAIFYSRSTA